MEQNKQLLFDMMRIRMVEEEIANRYNEGKMRCPVHLCIGQEAPAAGACLALRKEDVVFSTHRAHGHYLAKGGSLPKMVAEIYGKKTGCSNGKGGSMHLVDLESGFWGSTSIVSGTIPVAVGAALGFALQKTLQVAVSFFGDAATEEGLFHESVNFAVLHQLPIVFVCENNLYSVYTPLKDRQPKREIYELVRGHGIKSIQVDGNDVVAVYNAVKEAADRARQGEGPTFIECMTYRWREHCGPNYDNDLGYRTEMEADRWMELCPILQMKEKMITEKMIEVEEVRQWSEDIKEEIAAAFAFAEDSDFPYRDDFMRDIFQEPQEEIK